MKKYQIIGLADNIRHIFSPLLASIFIIFGIVVPCHAQSVENISAEVLKDVSFDEVYWVVSVSCQNIEEPRLMQQLSGESKWCASELSQFCDRDKMLLAEQLCSEQYDVLMADAIGSSSESSDTQIEEIVPELSASQTSVSQQAASVIESSEFIEPAVIQQAPVISSPVSQVEPSDNVGASLSAQEVSSIDTASNLAAQPAQMTAREIEIEEELIQLEEEMLTLRIQELELEQQEKELE